MATIRLNPKSSAVLIRKILKGAFPATAFSVTIGRGAGVSAVDVRWTDGPTAARVEALVKGFEQGRFDGMTDSYEYRRGADRYLIIDGQTYERGANYVSCARTITPALKARCAAQVAAYYGLTVPALPITAAQDREAMSRTGYWWDSLIWQCASDRTRFRLSTVEG